MERMGPDEMYTIAEEKAAEYSRQIDTYISIGDWPKVAATCTELHKHASSVQRILVPLIRGTNAERMDRTDSNCDGNRGETSEAGETRERDRTAETTA